MMINNINPFVNKSDWLKNLEQKLGFKPTDKITRFKNFGYQCN